MNSEKIWDNYYLYISKFTQVVIYTYHIIRRFASLKISESLVVSELWPWILLIKVMETIQVEGFQTCYQMYRNLTDKATWTSESEDIFESKQHQSKYDNIFGNHFRTMFIIFTYLHHLHFLDFNILNCIFHLSPFFNTSDWGHQFGFLLGLRALYKRGQSLRCRVACNDNKNHRHWSKAIGPARAWKMDGGSLTLWPRLEFYVADGVFLNRPTGFLQMDGRMSRRPWHRRQTK